MDMRIEANATYLVNYVTRDNIMQAATEMGATKEGLKRLDALLSTTTYKIVEGADMLEAIGVTVERESVINKYTQKLTAEEIAEMFEGEVVVE